MPTTSNFGWTTPADTDYVKDGALAIRTLGNGIDTSLVDLKGGTTGQILSKASNTDLDYTWINNDQGDITEVQAGTGISVASGTGPVPVVTNTVATAFDAKGDLIAGTGADTFSKLTAGTNEHRLVADSAQTTGLKYVADTTNYAIAAKGDVLVGTAADTLTALPVGTNGFVLTADSAQTSGVKWAAVSGGSLTLLATLSLSGASTSSSTLSAASYTHYEIIIKGVYLNNNGNMWMRLNSDTGNNYYRATLGSDTTTAFAQNAITSFFQISAIPTLTPVYNVGSGIIKLPRINDTDVQIIQSRMYSNFDSSSLRSNISSGVYDCSAAITSITFGTDQSFSAGTAYIYGVN